MRNPTVQAMTKATRAVRNMSTIAEPAIHAAVPDTAASTPGTNSADIALPNAHRHSLSRKLLPQKAWQTQNHQNAQNRLMRRRKHHHQRRPPWFQCACKPPLADIEITPSANIHSSGSQAPNDLDDNGA